MQYRNDKYGNKISALGYGCMRFTRKVGLTDPKKAEQEIMAAIEAGINYFDTAYIYPESEATLGKILEKNQVRDRVYIATKLPHYMTKSIADVERIFQEELKRLRTDHIDFYLMHMLTDLPTWERLKQFGITEWIRQKKQEGKIRQVGFSYHGGSDMFCKLVDVYDWDFCQIQYNYLDEHSQAGVQGLKHAHAKGLPVIIMEPLRGGKLVNNLPKTVVQLMAKHGKSPARYSFEWLYNQKEVTCVLSGMNSLEMLAENVKIADEARIGMLTAEDMGLYRRFVEQIHGTMLVNCTNCKYCQPCPRNVDIPGCFSAYNKIKIDGKLLALKEYAMCTLLRKNSTGASNCIKCGKCETHCPQGIPIRTKLEEVQKTMEGPLFRVIRKVLPFFMKY